LLDFDPAALSLVGDAEGTSAPVAAMGGGRGKDKVASPEDQEWRAMMELTEEHLVRA
jgi:hypothetical protein